MVAFHYHVSDFTSFLLSIRTKFFSARLKRTQPVSPRPVLLHQAVVFQMQNEALALIELQEASVWPLFQFIKVLLNDSSLLQCFKCSTQFTIICKLSKSAFWPIVEVINENITQHLTHYRPSRIIAGNWLSYSLQIIDTKTELSNLGSFLHGF